MVGSCKPAGFEFLHCNCSENIEFKLIKVMFSALLPGEKIAKIHLNS